MRIKDNDSFSKWLDANSWFEDGYFLACDSNEGLQTITIELGYQIEGTHQANTERALRVFAVRMENVQRFENFSGEDISDEAVIEGIDIIESNLLAFKILAEHEIIIECEEIVISEPFLRRDTVKPWLNHRELFISVPVDARPSPSDWLNWFRIAGFDLTWRFFASGPRTAEQVPSENYEGWILQEPRRIASTSTGLVFLHLARNRNEFHFHVCQGEACDSVWSGFERLLLRFEKIKISSGNCSFDRDSWRILLEEN